MYLFIGMTSPIGGWGEVPSFTSSVHHLQWKIIKRHKHWNTDKLFDFIFSCCYTLSIFLNAIQIGLLGYEFIEIFVWGVSSSKFSGGTSNSSIPNDVSKTGGTRYANDNYDHWLSFSLQVDSKYCLKLFL